MAQVTYPDGISPDLAYELYDQVEVPWSSKKFAYDESRSECQFWLNTFSAVGRYPQLVNVIRRGTDNAVRVFQWSDGTIFEQET